MSRRHPDGPAPPGARPGLSPEDWDVIRRDLPDLLRELRSARLAVRLELVTWEELAQDVYVLLASQEARGKGYDPTRGAQLIRWLVLLSHKAAHIHLRKHRNRSRWRPGADLTVDHLRDLGDGGYMGGGTRRDETRELYDLDQLEALLPASRLDQAARLARLTPEERADLVARLTRRHNQ